MDGINPLHACMYVANHRRRHPLGQYRIMGEGGTAAVDMVPQTTPGAGSRYHDVTPPLFGVTYGRYQALNTIGIVYYLYCNICHIYCNSIMSTTNIARTSKRLS